MTREIKKQVAEKTVAVLNRVLRTEANSAACCFLHQPKAPQKLKHFRRERHD